MLRTRKFDNINIFIYSFLPFPPFPHDQINSSPNLSSNFEFPSLQSIITLIDTIPSQHGRWCAGKRIPFLLGYLVYPAPMSNPWVVDRKCLLMATIGLLGKWSWQFYHSMSIPLRAPTLVPLPLILCNVPLSARTDSSSSKTVLARSSTCQLQRLASTVTQRFIL